MLIGSPLGLALMRRPDPRRILGSLLLGWWSASRPDLMTLNGAQISSWKDVVANYNLTQAVSGSRPLYSPTSFNGYPGVSFDGVDDCIDMASVPFPTGTSAGSELWAVYDQQALAADTTNRTLIAYGTGADSPDNAKRLIYRTVVSGQNRPAGYSNNVSAILAADFSGRHVLRAIFGSGFVNGGMDAVLAGAQGTVITATATRTRIGANCNNTPVQFSKGVLSDLFITGLIPAPLAAQFSAHLHNIRNP